MGPQDLPAVVLIHGAWHVPAHYHYLMKALNEAGFEAHCPHLPTCSGKHRANATLADDVTAARATVEPLVSLGCKVVVLAHSYGGVVTTNAVAGLSVYERALLGLSGGVIHLVYLTATLVPAGWAAIDIYPNGKPTPNASAGKAAPPSDLRQLLYHDIPNPVANDLADKFVPHAVDAIKEPVTHEAWRDIPLTYIYGTQDRVIPIERQRKMVARVKSAAETVEVREVVLQCGHAGYVNAVEEIVEVVVGICPSEKRIDKGKGKMV